MAGYEKKFSTLISISDLNKQIYFITGKYGKI